MEVPDGWLQVLRGPRPPAAKWPKVSKPQPGHVSPGRARPGATVVQSPKVRSLEAALSALGPGDFAANTGVESAVETRRSKGAP